MDKEGRDIFKAITKHLDRQATAAEKLLELAEREEMTVERGPSICPGCGKLNPTVTQLEGDGSGPLDEFVLKGETHCCNKTVYAIPDAWAVVNHRDEASSLLELQKGGNRG